MRQSFHPFCLRTARMLWLACAMCLAGLPARAADVTFLINENASAVTVYLRTSAGLLEPAFGVAPETLWSQTEDLDYGTLKSRLDARAPELWSELGIQSQRQVGTVAPMGIVMHPVAQPVPFDTPFAASLAAAVCVTPTEPVAALEALELYAGFVLRGVSKTDLVWTMAETGSETVTVSIQRFTNGTPTGTTERRVAPGEEITLGRMPERLSRFAPIAVLAGGLAVVALFGLRLRQRRKPALAEGS